MFRALLVSALALAPFPAFAVDDPSALLAAADRFRLPDRSSVVELSVTHVTQGKGPKMKEYTVYVKPERRSLVEFESAEEAGQLALQRDDAFYILLPRSRSPIRISPIQKLLGEASLGDISTMTWSGDYRVVGVETTSVRQGGLLLSLEASREGTTYGRIELTVDAIDHHPLSAQLYLLSGRIAKSVTYTMGTIGGRRLVTGMEIVDAVQNNALTTVTYRSIRAEEIPDRLFNPAYLVHARDQ